MIRHGWHTSPNRQTPTDPINFIFFGDAPAEAIAEHLEHTSPDRWRRVPTVAGYSVASSMSYAFIDDTLHGGRRGLKRPDVELTLGPFFSSTRLHIRIYQGFETCQHVDSRAGRWCIAAVHREHWSFPGWHIVHGWEEPRDFLHTAFASQSFVGRVFTASAPNAGLYQGYWFDGVASCVEIL